VKESRERGIDIEKKRRRDEIIRELKELRSTGFGAGTLGSKNAEILKRHEELELELSALNKELDPEIFGD
jgi:hypothetical protein